MNTYIVSDLHLGDKSPADNFASVEDRFKLFLDFVKQDKDHLLILNGDIFEIWQCKIGDIVTQYKDLLSILMKMNTIFMFGNHDIDFKGMENLPKGCEFFDRFKEKIILDREDKKIVIMHGHQMDAYNDPDKPVVTGRILSLLISSLEKTYPDSGIESFSQKHVEPVIRKITKFALNMYKAIFFKDHKSRPLTHLDSMDYYRKENPNNMLIVGHTHRAGWYGDWYINTGTWQEGEEAHYVKIVDNNEPILYSFPDNKIIKTQCEGTEYSKYSIKKLWENRKK